VVATVDGRAWETSVWRDKTGRTLLPVPATIRGPKGHGDDVTVALALRVVIRQARPAEAALVSGILSDAAEWLTARGIPMWQASELEVGRIDADVVGGHFFVADHGGEPVGVVRFQLTDPSFWPDVPEGESVFVHRLAVRRAFAGFGVSTSLLAWAVDRGASLGRRYLRLDCEASRPRLRAFYERCGFTFHSERQVGPYLVARYQRELEKPSPV
jgi:GNAT superfamily N-acetyltransferase